MLKIFMVQDKKLSVYLIITQELDPKLFMKLQEQDLKYQHLRKCFKDCR